MTDKPKTSTIKSLGNEDLALVNKLITLCGTLYERVSNPPKLGPHSNPSEIDNLKSQILLLSLRVGERVWYPRGNPGITTSLHIPKDRKRKKTH